MERTSLAEGSSGDQRFMDDLKVYVFRSSDSRSLVLSFFEGGCSSEVGEETLLRVLAIFRVLERRSRVEEETKALKERNATF